jgi:L-lactate dehydrogenase complex protein LldF
MSAHGLTDDFLQRAQHALGQDFLRQAVRKTTDRLRDGRAQAVREAGDFEAWRDALSASRRRAIARLDAVLRVFVERASAHGVQVHFAADAAEACAIVVELARAKGARLAAKGKSMLSEEIELNQALEAACVEALETDLGEWIIQLAGERPSHIILPVVHKPRAEIRELFEQHGGITLSDETKVLAGYARDRLRAEFLRADLGITGCNMAIAETGAVALFSNEGNGRMVSTLPKTHIALMGMERIVETRADFVDLMRLLPRSATGQRITTYVNVLHGPKRTHELDGPEELHVVVVDAGRSQQLADRDYREALACIRCGACLNACPVYSTVGGHAYGTVYPGPIGAVIEPLYARDDERRAELANASTLCGACHEACPVRIPLHDMLVSLRQANARQGRGDRSELALQRVAARAMAVPFVYAGGGAVTRWFGRFVAGNGAWPRFVLQHTPVLQAMARQRVLPQPPLRAFREQWADLVREDMRGSDGR